MKIDFVRDYRGRAIGITHLHGNGRREIRLTSGRLLGWFDPAMNRTVRVTGNFMGEGDQTMGLLHECL
ncbi:MAG: hypothetical protein ACJAYN_001309 [Bermanella sp.]|jgi:hypothetical protein